MTLVFGECGEPTATPVVEVVEAVPPPAAARAVGLRHVHDDLPGIRRRKVGRSFSYVDVDGRTIRDPEVLRRIRSMVIPPAWTDVWICPVANGHIQATGRDARGRKQYLYHPRWREVRDETKYHRMLAFGEALPQLRERTSEHLRRPQLPREKILATIVRLLDSTYIRVGNEEYARTNESYGLTTLQSDHVDVCGAQIFFHFRGKHGKEHRIRLTDRRLARVISRCRELPGQELFQYLDEQQQPRGVDSSDVNDYLREVSGHEFTAKDFRTWGGTVLAFMELHRLGRCETKTQANRNISAAIKCVAERLGNTAAICRKCYVHPAVLDAYSDSAPELLQYEFCRPSATPGLSPEEDAVLRLLRRNLAAAAARPRRGRAKRSRNAA